MGGMYYGCWQGSPSPPRHFGFYQKGQYPPLPLFTPSLWHLAGNFIWFLATSMEAGASHTSMIIMEDAHPPPGPAGLFYMHCHVPIDRTASRVEFPFKQPDKPLIYETSPI
ncbi:hypothetical protein GDO81_024795 [Engystomops pustulosus]|uniref:Uncharacterized protein n=1 Tax=Engystomops pustulosus TaxID=76066 RepID=A0AAV6YIH5_ENGPU|nr:hypothetical protein GDO81_024795 [Engystomops pustulosus]